MEVKFNVPTLYLALFGEAPILKAGAGEAVEKALKDLSARERRVLTQRFGLVDGQIRTRQQVGDEFGVSWERIRQIEDKALEGVRNSKHSELLKRFIIG